MSTACASSRESLRSERHPACVVCSQANGAGLRISFRAKADGSVEGVFACAPAFQGYADRLHGGIVCCLLDGAMTNCLFELGEEAVTAELTVRFLHPVSLDRDAIVRARRLGARRQLFTMEAEMEQDGVVLARGTAKFLRLGKATPRQDSDAGRLETRQAQS
jgi:uncharacterized protein (TIGR00369 family)